MKKPLCAATILTALATSPPVSAERQITNILYEGTPESIVWNLTKAEAEQNLQGSMWFQGVPNSANAAPYTDSTWTIPAFDTGNGTKKLTGVSVHFTGRLQATFNGDAVGRNRNIEGYFREATLQVAVTTPNGNSNPIVEYAANSHNWESKRIPANEQTTAIVWNLDQAIDENSWVLRPTPDQPNKAAGLDRIGQGLAKLTLNGSMSWMPYYLFERDWQNLGIRQFYADCGTNNWSIPNELPNGMPMSNAYPADELGRRLDAFMGLPNYPYPIGFQPTLYTTPAVYYRKGATSPIKVEVTYFYTQVGDPDFDKSLYSDAGNYAADFELIDNSYPYYNNPADTGNHKTPGNKQLEYGEFKFAANEQKGSSGIFLIDFNTDNKTDACYGRSVEYHFNWMDTDKNGTVSMTEYKNWRLCLDAAITKYGDPQQNPITYFPGSNYPTAPTPAVLTATITGVTPPIDPPIDPPVDPTRIEYSLFTFLDTDKTGQVSKTEWLEIYATKPRKEIVFESIDTNKDGGITPTEMTAAATKSRPPTQLTQALTRTVVFNELNNNPNDTIINRQEINLMWGPGTAARTIDSTWNRMIKNTEKTGVTYPLWIKGKTLPSLSTYNTAKNTRNIRKQKFLQLDGAGNTDGLLSRTEFTQLFRLNTRSTTIDSTWMKATGTPTKGTPPATMTQAQFLNCTLTGATIK